MKFFKDFLGEPQFKGSNNVELTTEHNNDKTVATGDLDSGIFCLLTAMDCGELAGQRLFRH